ncbi:MAG: YggT family protein [Coriobacteriales bacterium]|jgi:YggT family protein|nr:YggT family protein [Coriobacteriales bacterium]
MGFQLATILSSIINLYCLIIFVWAILSWFQSSNKTVRDIYRVLDTVVAPYVNLFRRFIPPLGGMDLSPLIALIVLQILSRLLLGFLM